MKSRRVCLMLLMIVLAGGAANAEASGAEMVTVERLVLAGADQESSLHVSLHVNGDPRELPTGCTVARLIDALDLGGRRVAVAINRDVIPRSRYATHCLQQDDRVEILEAVGGG